MYVVIVLRVKFINAVLIKSSSISKWTMAVNSRNSIKRIVKEDFVSASKPAIGNMLATIVVLYISDISRIQFTVFQLPSAYTIND